MMEEDGIEYRIAQPPDEDILRDLYFSVFFRREIITLGLKIERVQESRPFADIVVPQACKSGLSILAIDKSTNKAIGFRSTVLATPGNPQNWSFPADDENCRKLRLMFAMVGELHAGVNFFERYGVEKVAFFRGLAVKSEYCQRGIAQKMVRKSLEAAKQHGCRLAVVESSGAYSRRVFEKEGFKTIKTLPYKEYCLEGKQLIPSEGENTEMYLHVKEI